MHCSGQCGAQHHAGTDCQLHGGTHRHAFYAQHPVNAVRPAAVASPPHGFAVADHDIVLLQHFALPVGQHVVSDQLHNSGDASPACTLLLQRGLHKIGLGFQFALTFTASAARPPCMLPGTRTSSSPPSPSLLSSSASICSFVSSCGMSQDANALSGLSEQCLHKSQTKPHGASKQGQAAGFRQGADEALAAGLQGRHILHTKASCHPGPQPRWLGYASTSRTYRRPPS